MSGAPQSRTLEAHGRLWGAQARDWADFMEGTCRPVFQAVLDRTGVGPGTRYLDVGCGTGMAAGMAAARGAEASGLDAAEGMLAIARERVTSRRFPPGRSGGLAVCGWHIRCRDRHQRVSICRQPGRGAQ